MAMFFDGSYNLPTYEIRNISGVSRELVLTISGYTCIPAVDGLVPLPLVLKQLG
jgi:hypothetical protein